MEQDSFAGKKPREEAPEPYWVTTADTAKQDHEEFAGLADIRPCRNAAIHGLLLDLSPVKTSKRTNATLMVTTRMNPNARSDLWA